MHDKTALLGKDNLNTIEVLIFKAIINLYIVHEEFVSANNVSREYNEIKERNKKSWNFCRIYYIKTKEKYCVSCKKYTANKNSSAIKTK